MKSLFTLVIIRDFILTFLVLLICSAISLACVASAIIPCRPLPLNPAAFSTHGLAFPSCPLAALRADDKRDPDVTLVPPKGSSGWVLREIWILGDWECAGDEPGCIMGAERVWANRRGEVRIFRSPANTREVQTLCAWGNSNDIFFIHTYHSEPEERTSLEIKGENMPPRRRRILKTKFIHWKLHSYGRQRDQNLCWSSSRKCWHHLLFSEPLLLTHPVAVLFLAREDVTPHLFPVRPQSNLQSSFKPKH